MAPIVLSAPLEGWIVALDDVPDPVFATRMLGDGIAIDPTGGRLHAPCAGRIVGLQPTGHAVTIETAEGARVLIHLGIDTVAMEGHGFTPRVAVGDQVATGDALVDFDLDRMVREARAVVTPILLVESEGFAITSRAAAGPIAVGAPLLTLEATGPVVAGPALVDADETHARVIAIALPHGIHARPAGRIAALARSHDAAITLAKGDRSASARSPTGLLGLGIGHGDTVVVAASGTGAAAAVDAIVALIAHGLAEEVPVAAAPAPPVSTDEPVPAGAIRGVTAAAGLAIGRVVHRHTIDATLPLDGRGVAIEATAFAAARTALAADLTERAAAAAGPARAIFTAHAEMLEDPALIDATEAGIGRGEGAAHAWRGAIRTQADALRATGDARLAERTDDLLDLERQMLALLTGVARETQDYPPGTVLLADDLLPSELMGATGLAALCTAKGGPTSHVAILAASMGLPALVALGPRLRDIAAGAEVIVDATGGLLHIAPSADTLADATRSIARAQARRADALARGATPCRTADGTRIEVFANLGTRADADAARANAAEGCGLLRTEFLFLDRDTPPGVAEQAADYQAIADALDGKPLIVRLLDIGGDKPAPYLPSAQEENPALGLRGIRTGLAHPALLEDQLRAILSVRPIGQCRIMLPMVASLAELRAVRAVLDRLRGELGIADAVALGIMVETPAAAVTADLLAGEADFLSIGTNDLTQYALAMDRTNPAVADGLDGLHPAVLRLIGETCRGGAIHGRWVGVCGGLAADPLAVPILLGMGVTELSVPPAMVPTIKALVADLTLVHCRDHAAQACRCASAQEVRALARAFETKETAA